MDVTQRARQVFNEYAETYQSRFMDTGLYHESFDKLLKRLAEGATVLDAGCGPGNILHYLIEQRPDLRCHGIDVAPKMLELAAVNNPTANFELLDARDFLKVEGTFDAIIAGFLFPYFSREEIEKFFKDASRKMNPGGLLYISTMEDDFSKSGLHTTSAGNKLFIYYHSKNWFQKSLEQHGYAIAYSSYKHYEDSAGKPVTDLMLLAAKK